MNRAVLPVVVVLLGIIPGTIFAAPQQDGRRLKVVEHIWGFDGRVQPGQFNPLSILLDNETDEPIDATVTLQRVQGMLNLTGGQYTQQVFISPTARRWIQFYPYVSDTQECDWRLSLGNRKLTEIAQARPSWRVYNDKQDVNPQVIILDRADRISTQPPTLKHLPENVFPPYATATFGLHTVYLDHVPDWESPRQKAFMSWLSRGGRLQILKDSRGEFPQFSGALTELNRPLDEFRIGSGIVVRHAVQRNDVTEEMISRSMVIDVLQNEDKEIERQIEEQFAQRGMGGLGALVDTDPMEIDETLFRNMRELTLPEHAWWLIFLLALCYIGLIFPGCFTLSKKRSLHFLTTYGAIAGLSILFSGIFLLIGRRGYGEKTNLQTMAIARAEGSQHWSVFEWNALFVTSGDDYDASTEDQESVFSTADVRDQPDVRILAGNSGRIDMKIPPFSSQTFVARRRIPTTPWNLQIKSITLGSSEAVRLRIGANDDLPKGPDVEYRVLIGRKLYEMRFDEKTSELELLGRGSPLAAVAQQHYAMDFTQDYGQWQNDDQPTEQEVFYERSLSTLVRRSLVDDLMNKPLRFELPSDRVRLFVYADYPEEFRMKISAAARATGRILYLQDVFLADRSQ